MASRVTGTFPATGNSVLPAGFIAPFYLSAATIAAKFTAGLGNSGDAYEGWAICNGSNGTPNLSAKFLRFSVSDSGGTGGNDSSAHTHSVTSNVAVGDHASHTHNYTQVLNHTHAVNITDSGHSHTYKSQTATTGSATSYEHGVIDTSSAEANEGESTDSATTGITATTSNPAGGVATGTTAGPSATLTHSVTNNAVTSGAASATENRPAYYELVPLMKV